MDELQPPFRLIAEALRHGRVVPFLGAGASFGCRLKGAVDDDHLPSGSGLAERLAVMSGYPAGEQPNLAAVAQYFEVVSGRNPLNDELREIFLQDFEPSRLHSTLAAVPGPLLIVTTNYDDLIEEAFADRPYDLVVHTTDPSLHGRLLWWPHGAGEPEHVLPKNFDVDLETTTVIYKMHGAVDRHTLGRDQFVITENDYVEFLTRLTSNKALPGVIAEHFRERHFLFLGYGLEDWNLRVVLHRMQGDERRAAGVRSWAIDLGASALGRRIWQDRGVELYAMTIEDFLDGLGI